MMLSYKKELLISKEEKIYVNEHMPKQPELEHKHDFFELVYTKSGECIHCIDDVKYATHHGDLVFISCGQTHSFEVSAGTRLVNILITPEFISSELIDTESIITLFRHSMFAEFEVSALPCQSIHFDGAELNETEFVIDMLIREYNAKKPGYKSVMHGGVRILFSKLLRRIKPTDNNDAAKANVLLDDIISYIDENYSQKISLKEIAAQTFYNPVYFGNLLKKYCGKNFSAYLKEKRISKAAEMLKTTNKSIEYIMSEVGYSDKKLFYNHFKEMYNITPGKFNKL